MEDLLGASLRLTPPGLARKSAPDGFLLEPANESRITILAVDDVPDNLAVLGELLQPTYRLRAATSAQRALEILALAPLPDLILLDVMMPVMDGFALFRLLREEPRTRDIPVMFITALNATEEEERGLEMGAVDYITKPLRPPIVMARIHTQLELKRARDLLKDQNAFLDAEVRRRMRENQIIQDVSINALSRLAGTRDTETGSHIRRTQEYVRILAIELWDHPRFKSFLNDHTIDLLAKSAPLHDIGKVGIPDQILLKPGKLTPEEWAVMKTHAKLGADAIEQAERDAGAPVEFLALAKEIAHWHHERWDGSGYPDGLAGYAIPISARLMALADVFDALINRRVYKEAVPVDESRAIIISESGSHFDPDVVDAFLATFDRFLSVAMRYAENGSS